MAALVAHPNCRMKLFRGKGGMVSPIAVCSQSLLGTIARLCGVQSAAKGLFRTGVHNDLARNGFMPPSP